MRAKGGWRFEQLASRRPSVARGIVTLLGYDATESDPLHKIFAPHASYSPATFVDSLRL